MRSLWFSLMLIVVNLSVYSQNCSSPVSNIVFQKKLNQLTVMRQEQQRFDVASEFAQKNCLLTGQVRQIAQMFKNDISRLDFIQDAYGGIFDMENIYDLYDAFANFSTVMRFHDFIEDQSHKQSRPGRRSETSERQYTFPEYNYPSYENYHETSLCSQPLSDEMFYNLVRNVMSQKDDESRVQIALQLAQGNCLTVSQIMKMGSLIEKEPRRLDYLKRSYDHTYDVGNYQYSNQLLKEKTYSTDFDNFVRDRRSNKPGRNEPNRTPEGRGCRVSDTELQEIVANIKGQSFESTQLTMAKQIVRAKQCFTTMQIKQIIEIFTFENTRLDMAKYCFEYCTDRDDYYKINSSFTFSHSVDDLTKFINEKH